MCFCVILNPDSNINVTIDAQLKPGFTVLLINV